MTEGPFDLVPSLWDFTFESYLVADESGGLKSWVLITYIDQS